MRVLSAVYNQSFSHLFTLSSVIYPDGEDHTVPPQRCVQPECLQELGDILASRHL